MAGDTPPHVLADRRNKFLQYLRAALQNKLWQKAALHRNGKGIENQPVLEGTVKYFNYLKTKNRHKDAGVLYAMASAGLWPNDRRSTGDDLCPRCGLRNETDFHVIYECTKNHDPIPDTVDADGIPIDFDPDKKVMLEDRVFAVSKHLPKLAKSGVTNTPAYWLRGLLPKSFLPTIPPPLDSYPLFVSGKVKHGVTFYTDCSGWEQASSRELCRCG